MLDTLDKFDTIRDGDLVLRMHKDEAPVLQEYALPLAHQALDTLSASATSSRRRGRSSSRCSPSTTTSPCATSACPA